MRWLASRSNEYCLYGNTVALFPCGVARNCPKSNEFAAVWDTSFVEASTLRGTPDVVCGAAYSPIAFSCGHRKMPANAAHPEFGYTWPAAVSDGRFRTKPAPVEAGFPTGQTRRRRSWARWPQVGLRTCESVFFRRQPRVVAFFPCFRASKLDFFLMQNAAKCFNADLRDDLFGNEILPQFFQRPSLKWTAQKVRRTFCRFSDKGLVILGEFIWSARSRLRVQRFKTAFVKIFDNRPNMMFGIVDQFGNRGHFVSLIGGQHHLGTANLNSTGTAAENPLDLLSFANTKVSGIQTHKKSLSMLDNIEFILRVCLYNTHLCIAQVLISEKVEIIFWKRQ